MQIIISGYQTWKHAKEELNIFNVYVLPTLIVYYDNILDWDNDYPVEIKFAWLFWELRIYLGKRKKE